jgi:hypothetical protein
MYSKYDPKACQRCIKMHICTGTVHCPCYDLEIPGIILDYIASHFDECLCNECMEELKQDIS